MKFMRRITGYSLLDHKKNEDILEELKVDPIENKLAQYKQKWLNHVSRMKNIRYPSQILDCRSIGRRRTGRSLKRLLDGYSRGVEAGHLFGLTSWLEEEEEDINSSPGLLGCDTV